VSAASDPRGQAPDDGTGRLPDAVVPGPTRPGPALAAVVHRLAQAPSDLLDPRVLPGPALGDLAADLDGAVLDRTTFAAIAADLPPGSERAGLALLTAWVLADAAVRTDPGAREAAGAAGGASWLLLRAVERVPRVLAGLRAPREWLTEVETREELARAVLAVCGLRPAGEDAARAADAWAAVSTAHRRSVFAQMQAERRRAEELAARLAEQKAKEAAAQYANY
jgi:hypothetical protein